MAKKHERGSALTEFVIIVPVMLALIYGSMYLSELGTAKIKAQEIARFGAFAVATQPLSDYKNRRHTQRHTRAITTAAFDSLALYDDLNAARSTVLPRIGREGLTLRAINTTLPTDLKMKQVDMLPAGMDSQWATALGPVGLLLTVLGVGTGTQSLFAGPFNRLGFNGRGLVESQARMTVQLPSDDANQARATHLAKVARGNRADLSDFILDGQVLADGDGGKPIKTVLIADDWRLLDGASARPAAPGARQTPYIQAVEHVSKNSLRAVPGGNLLDWLSRLLSPWDSSHGPYVFSRPYIETRSSSHSRASTRQVGQVDVSLPTDMDVRGSRRSRGVRLFETLPLYVDHDSGSPFAEHLQERGRYFMGCPYSEQARCRW